MRQEQALTEKKSSQNTFLRGEASMEPAERQSLMSKWKMHYHSRDFKPKDTTANRWGVGFFLVFGVTCVYTSLRVAIPVVTRHEPVHYEFYLRLGVWIVYVQMLLNWFLIIRKTRLSIVREDSYQKIQQQKSGQLPDQQNLQTQEGWINCPKCQLDAPPRSHHCKVCKVCFLKRDHHCYFTATCIGFHTQRYFLVFLFYNIIGTASLIALNLRYVHHFLPLFSYKMAYYFLPISLYQLIMGEMRGWCFLLLLQSYFAGVILTAASMFLFWEFVTIYRGQTSYEVWKNIQKYRVEPKYNFRSVFGPYWLLNFIVPLPTSQEGNGFTWEMHKRHKGN